MSSLRNNFHHFGIWFDLLHLDSWRGLKEALCLPNTAVTTNVAGQGVPFDSRGKPQQLIQTHLNSFNLLWCLPASFISGNLNLIKRLHNPALTLMPPFCHSWPPSLSVRHGNKCTHMRAVQHGVMVMMDCCQNLYQFSHWRKGDDLQVLMREALVHYSRCSDSRLGLSYSGDRLKDPWFPSAEVRREL